jgi:hypothetical protein
VSGAVPFSPRYEQQAFTVQVRMFQTCTTRETVRARTAMMFISAAHGTSYFSFFAQTTQTNSSSLSFSGVRPKEVHGREKLENVGVILYFWFLFKSR